MLAKAGRRNYIINLKELLVCVWGGGVKNPQGVQGEEVQGFMKVME